MGSRMTDARSCAEPGNAIVHLRVADLDYLGHLTEAKYVAFLEESRVRWLQWVTREAQPAYAVVRHELLFRSEVRLDDSPIEIESEVVRVGRSSIDVWEHVIVPGRGIATESSATLVMWDRSTRGSRILTQTERERLARLVAPAR